MTDKNKIWYPDEVIKAINDFYNDIKKGAKPKAHKQDNKNNDLSNNKNFPHRVQITPQVCTLSLF